MNEPTSRAAVVTGVSRGQGIGFAIAQRLLAAGLSVLIHSVAPHDGDQPWALAAGGLSAVIDELSDPGDRLDHIEADFAAPHAPRRVIDHAVDRFGGVDVLVVNHTMSAMGRLDEVTAEGLDLAWAVNARATVLLVQAFAEHNDDRPDGRVLLFTSGQHLGPMADELPYAISKGARSTRWPPRSATPWRIGRSRSTRSTPGRWTPAGRRMSSASNSVRPSPPAAGASLRTSQTSSAG
jgi:3-oxoacyl-[acyl-carrier protein] reductase